MTAGSGEVSIGHHEARLSHGVTRYLAAGAGDPVILLHGVSFLAGGDSWLLNIGPLASRFRVLAPDFLGWGPGDQLGLGYSFAYLVDFVREFQDALGLRRSHVVGHSLGGWIASLLAYESPARVERLVLVASGGLATRNLAQMTEWSPPTPEAVRDSVAAVEAAGIDTRRMVQERLERARDRDRVENFRKIMAHMTEPRSRRRYHLARRLPFVESPTLILWGADDPVNSAELSKEAHRLIAGSRLTVFPGRGHGLPTECPKEFNDAVLSFLAE